MIAPSGAIARLLTGRRAVLVHRVPIVGGRLTAGPARGRVVALNTAPRRPVAYAQVVSTRLVRGGALIDAEAQAAGYDSAAALRATLAARWGLDPIAFDATVLRLVTVTPSGRPVRRRRAA